MFWKAARASTVNAFERAIEEIQKLDENAANWLRDKPRNEWCRAFFREFPKCDVLTNNACETFNANILEARKRPILTMLQQLHIYLMKRFVKNRDTSNTSSTWQDVLCPRIQDIIDEFDKRISDYVPIKSANEICLVSSICNDSDQYGVDIKVGVCGCRRWQLSGMPCIHAIVALNHLSLEAQPFTHKWYEVDTYKRTYMLPIYPLNTVDEWPKTNHIPILPPPAMKRKPGRPRTERRLGVGEVTSHSKKKKNGGQSRIVPGGKRLRRNQCTVKCSKCGQSGHNARGCKGEKAATSTDDPATGPQSMDDQIISRSTTSDMTKGKGIDIGPTLMAASGPTLMSFMTELRQIPSQEPVSQNSVNMVHPPTLLQDKEHRSYADLSGPVPAIIKDGKRFMTMKNILKKADMKRKKN